MALRLLVAECHEGRGPDALSSIVNGAANCSVETRWPIGAESTRPERRTGGNSYGMPLDGDQFSAETPMVALDGTGGEQNQQRDRDKADQRPATHGIYHIRAGSRF
jgi:hypothetical protein